MSEPAPFAPGMMPEDYWSLTYPLVHSFSTTGGNEYLSSIPNASAKLSLSDTLSESKQRTPIRGRAAQYLGPKDGMGPFCEKTLSLGWSTDGSDVSSAFGGSSTLWGLTSVSESSKRRFDSLGDQSSVMVCGTCEEQFKGTYRKRNLNRHMLSMHSEKELIACEVEGCSRSYKRSDALIVHMRKEHTNIAPLLQPRKKATTVYGGR